METAMQLFLPILAGLWLGVWLTRSFGLSSLWTPGLAILGMALGIAVLAKKSMFNRDGSRIQPFIPKGEKGLKSNSSPAWKAVEKQSGLMPHELDFLYEPYEDDPNAPTHPYNEDHLNNHD
jgi:hypothetical protein